MINKLLTKIMDKLDKTKLQFISEWLFRIWMRRQKLHE